MVIDHKDFEMLLPWYANGSLNEYDTTRMSSHLETCERCRQDMEMSLCHARALHESKDLKGLLQQRENNFARLRDRIQFDKTGASLAVKFKDRFTRVALAVVLLASVSAIFVWDIAPDRQYMAMTTNPPANGPVLQVIFHPETSERDIRLLLLESQAELLGSPSPSGVYRLSISASEDPRASVEKVRAHSSVRWAIVEVR